MTKTCSKCGEARSLDEFGKKASNKDGLQSWCKACLSIYSREYGARNRDKLNAYNREYRAANPLMVFASGIKRHYGITLADYDVMLEAQGGVCAICGKTPGENGRRLCVDHDHETNEVRGLLCTHCNVVLGYWHDNPETARQAMLYLRRKSCE